MSVIPLRKPGDDTPLASACETHETSPLCSVCASCAIQTATNEERFEEVLRKILLLARPTECGFLVCKRLATIAALIDNVAKASRGK